MGIKYEYIYNKKLLKYEMFVLAVCGLFVPLSSCGFQVQSLIHPTVIQKGTQKDVTKNV